jgi:hypothetical protein
VPLDRPRGRGLLLERPRAQCRGHDPAALAHQHRQVELGLRARADPDHDDPPAGLERLDVVGQVRRADQLEDHVERAVVGEPLRVDDRVRAELLDRGSLGLVAHGRRYARARRARELDRRRAHAAGRAVHEQTVAHLEPRLREEGVVRRREDLGKAACRRPVERLRHRHRLALVNHRELALAAPTDDRHHPVALVEPGRAGATAHDLAGQLESRDVLRLAGRRGVAATALEHVGAVQAGRLDADQQLSIPRFGVWVLLNGDIAVSDRCRPHCGKWYVRPITGVGFRAAEVGQSARRLRRHASPHPAPPPTDLARKPDPA